MKMRLTVIPAMLIVAAVCSGTALAQSSGGSFGGGTTGSTGSTASSGTSGSTGLAGLTTSGFSSQLATGMTTGSTGTTGTTGSTGTTGGGGTTGGAAGTTGNAAAPGFVGANATQTFVGGAREATSQQNTNRQFQQFMQEAIASSSQSQQSGTPREIRTTMRIGFSFPTASAAQQSGRLANANALTFTRFTSTRPEFSGINVSLANDGTAVLTGFSPSTETSRLAANLIRLQPGVRNVKNEVAVAQE